MTTIQKIDQQIDANDIVIVSDGQYRWGVERAAIEVAMLNTGWTQEGLRWIEPENDGSEAYTALCQRVQPAPGYDPDNNSDNWDDLPSLTFRPDLGERIWVMEG